MPNDIKITVLYFASLADKSGTDEEVLMVNSDKLGDIYQSLKDKYAFDLPKEKLAVAINHHFVDWQTPICDGDTVAFIPPVAGG